MMGEESTSTSLNTIKNKEIVLLLATSYTQTKPMESTSKKWYFLVKKALNIQ